MVRQTLIKGLCLVLCVGSVHAEKLLEAPLILSPQFIPKGSEICLSMVRDEKPAALYTFSLQNQSLRRVNPSSEEIELSPSYSPDGKQIAYISEHKGYPEIFIKSAQHSPILLLGSPGEEYLSVGWSPDGKQLAFIKKKGESFYLGSVSPKGKNQKILVEAYFIESFSWSPQGETLFYVSQDQPNQNFTINAMNLNDQSHSQYAGLDCLKFVPSPDGKWVAWVQQTEGEWLLKITEVGGEKEFILARAHLITGFTWSPDSQSLAYTSQSGTKRPFELSIIDLDPSELD